MSKLRDLYIIEISPCIHAGDVNKRAFIEAETVKIENKWRTPSIHTGGPAFIFNFAVEAMQKGDVVFVADRTPTMKRSIYPNYKSNRSYRSNIENQKTIAEEVLANCGFQIFAEEGYEADDLLYSLVEKYKSEYKMIYIYTGDSDMHICVDKNVVVLPVRKTDPVVTYQNYEFTTRRDAITPFCSSSFLKMLGGDSSDCVTALPKSIQKKLNDYFWNDVYFPIMKNRDVMRALIETYVPEALLQFEVIYPIKREVDIDLDTYEPNMMKVREWAYMVGNSKVGVCPRKRSESVNKLVASFFERGMETIEN